jgi:hypothetical protein
MRNNYENDIEYIVNKFNSLCEKKSDINEHLPTLYKYATECESAIECIILSWNFVEEIIIKLQDYRNTGMRIIIPFPEIKII